MVMQATKREMKNEKGRGKKPDHTKRTMLILTAGALALILAVLLLLSGLLSGLSGERRESKGLEDYLAEDWPIFRLRHWDAESGDLELEYPLRFSYAQMEKYGASVEELRELPAGNLATVESLRTAARERTGTVIRTVTVYGLTNDGRVAYTLLPDGSVRCCWEQTEDR